VVFNVESPPKLAAKSFRNNARRNIGNAAGRKGQDDTYGLARIFGVRTGLPLRKGKPQQNKPSQGHPDKDPGGGAIKKCHGVVPGTVDEFESL